MFGLKKKEDVSTEKACPFTFPLTLMNKDRNQFSKCIKASCQLWDEERQDCGLKQK